MKNLKEVKLIAEKLRAKQGKHSDFAMIRCCGFWIKSVGKNQYTLTRHRGLDHISIKPKVIGTYKKEEVLIHALLAGLPYQEILKCSDPEYGNHFNGYTQTKTKSGGIEELEWNQNI